MRTVALAAALLAHAAWAQAPATLSPTAFRDRLSAAIGAMTHQPVVAVDEHTLRVKQQGRDDLTIYTDNAYAQYQADPLQIDAVVSRYSRLLLASDAGGEPVEQLVLVVRPSDYVTRSIAAGASTKNFLPGHPIAGDLSYFLAVDSSETIRTAGPTDLARWGLTEAAAWSRAIANVKVRVGPLEMIRLGDENGPSGLTAASGLAPSIISDPAFCGPAAPTGMDQQVVFVLSRDTLLFAMPSDSEQTKRFWAAVDTEAANGRTLSSTPLTCRVGKWTIATHP